MVGKLRQRASLGSIYHSQERGGRKAASQLSFTGLSSPDPNAGLTTGASNIQSDHPGNSRIDISRGVSLVILNLVKSPRLTTRMGDIP